MHAFLLSTAVRLYHLIIQGPDGASGLRGSGGTGGDPVRAAAHPVQSRADLALPRLELGASRSASNDEACDSSLGYLQGTKTKVIIIIGLYVNYKTETMKVIKCAQEINQKNDSFQII